MAIRHVLKGIHHEDIIPISFTNTSTKFNIKFSRDGNSGTITIPSTNFNTSQTGPITSTTKIPDNYIPTTQSAGWIIINGSNGFVSSSIIFNPDGTITMYYGTSGNNFQSGQIYITMNTQTLSYLI